MAALIPKPLLFLDACLLITLGARHALELVTENPRFTACAGLRALSEVRSAPATDVIEAAWADDQLWRVAVDLEDPDQVAALARFDGMATFRDRGDAETLALALCRGGLVGSDDRAVRRAAVAEVGAKRLVGTLDLIVWSVRDGRMDVEGAEAVLSTLDVGPGLLSRLKASGWELRDLS